MGLIYLAGLASNLVTITGNIFSSSSEDANFPNENVGTGWPAEPFKFNAAAADDQITVDLTDVISVDYCSVHGHNIDSGISAIQLRKSSDNFSASDELVATMTKASPTFYTTFASTAFRYWRLKFVGTNTATPAPITIGEWVLGVTSTLTNDQLITWEIEDVMGQSRQTGGLISQVFAVNMSDFRQRNVKLSFIAENYTQRDQIRDNMLVNSKFGEEPLIFVPDITDEIAIHGRMPNNLDWKRTPGPSGGYHRVTFTVEEDPFSIALP